jgi:hypothetical protein
MNLRHWSWRQPYCGRWRDLFLCGTSAWHCQFIPFMSKTQLQLRRSPATCKERKALNWFQWFYTRGKCLGSENQARDMDSFSKSLDFFGIGSQSMAPSFETSDSLNAFYNCSAHSNCAAPRNSTAESLFFSHIVLKIGWAYRRMLTTEVRSMEYIQSRR